MPNKQTDAEQRQEDVRQQQEEQLREILERAGAYEELIRTKGFQHLKAYYHALIQQLATDLITNTERQTADFDQQRRELIGINKMFSLIDNDLRTLASYRKEQDGKSAKQ